MSGGPSATQRGANVQIWDCLGPLSTNQLWRFSSAPDGLPQIAGAGSGQSVGADESARVLKAGVSPAIDGDSFLLRATHGAGILATDLPYTAPARPAE